MGAGDSKEIQRIFKDVKQLNKDKTQWKRIVSEFLDLPFNERDSLKTKVELKIFDVLVELLIDREHGAKTPADCGQIFEALSRVLTNKYLLKQISRGGNEVKLSALINAVYTSDSSVTAIGLKALLRIVQVAADSEFQEAAIEADNKRFFTAEHGFDAVVGLLTRYRNAKDDFGKNIVKMALKILNSALVHRELTTNYDDSVHIQELLVKNFDIVLGFLCHSDVWIRLDTCTLVKYTMLNATMSNFAWMQERALETGALLWQLHFSMNSSQEEEEEEWWRDQQGASRQLVGLFCDNNPRNMRALKQILPEPILDWSMVVPGESTVADHGIAAEIKDINNSNSNTPARPKSTRFSKVQLKALKSTVKALYDTFEHRDWNKMFAAMEKDYEAAELIWNENTRAEVTEKILAEITDMQLIMNMSTEKVKWQAEDFEVIYECLKDELKAGPYYLNLLNKELDARDPEKSRAYRDLQDTERAVAMMRSLYNQCVIENDHERKQIILIVMKKLFAMHESSSVFDNFEYMPYLLWMLSPEQYNGKVWREDLLLLLKKLLSRSSNIKKFISLGGIPLAIQHLYSTHALADTTENIASAVNILALLDAVCTFPRSKRLLSIENNFQHIVQALLINDINVANQTVFLLSQIVESNPLIHPSLYKTGMFLFLMRLLKNGCSEVISMLLRDYHQLQAHKPGFGSYLQYFLPEPLIALLQQDRSTEKFTEAINGDCKRHNLYWCAKFRDHLVREVERQLQDFLAVLKQTPNASYEYCTPEKIVYEEIENEFCVGNVYLRFYCENPNVELEDPELLLHYLVESFDIEKRTAEQITLILQTQIELFRRFHDKNEFIRYSGMHKLIEVLNAGGVNFSKACELLAVMFEVPREHSVHNLNAFLANDEGLEKIRAMLYRMVAQGVHSEADSELVANAFRALSTIASNEAVHKFIAMNDSFFYQVAQFISVDMISKFPKLVEKALTLMSSLTESKLLHAQVVRSGAIFPLFHVGVLHKFNMNGDSNSNESDRNEAIRRLVLLAVTSLSNISSHELARHVLSRCLTINLYYMLTSHTHSSLFVQYTRSEVETPLIIWNEAMRNELLSEVLGKFWYNQSEEQQRQYMSASWDPKEGFGEFQFESLKDEIFINNIYVRVFNQQPTFVINNPNPETFMTRLLFSIIPDNASLSELVARASNNNGDNQGGADTNDGTGLLLLVRAKITAILNLLKNHETTIDVVPLAQVQARALEQLRTGQSTASSSSPSSATGGKPGDIISDLFYHAIILSDKHLIATIIQIYQIIAKSVTSSSCLIPSLLGLQKLMYAQLKPAAITTTATINNAADDSSSSTSPYCCYSLVDMLQIFTNLCQLNTQAATRVLETGLFLLILYTFATSKSEDERDEAARALGSLTLQLPHQAGVILTQLMNPQFKEYLVEAYTKPKSLIEYYDEDHETPVIIWNHEVKNDLLTYLERELKAIGIHLACTHFDQERKDYTWSSTSLYNYQRPSLSRELKIGNVFIRCFNENPFFKMDKPDAFIDALLNSIENEFARLKKSMERGIASVGSNSNNNNDDDDNDDDGYKNPEDALNNLLLMWQAVEHLVKNTPKMSEEICIIEQIPLFFEHLALLDNTNSSSSSSSTISKLHALADKVLSVVLLLAKNETIVRVMVNSPAVMDLMHVVFHHPQKSLAVLSIINDMVIRNPESIKQLRLSGAILYLLQILLEKRSDGSGGSGSGSGGAREMAAEILCKAAADAKYGAELNKYICLFLTPKFKTKFEQKPEKFLEFFDADHEAEYRAWNDHARETLKLFIQRHINELEKDYESSWNQVDERFNVQRLNDIYPGSITLEDTLVNVPLSSSPPIMQ